MFCMGDLFAGSADYEQTLSFEIHLHSLTDQRHPMLLGYRLYSRNFYIWEVEREDEFSPLKNAESAGRECLSTCKRDLAHLNK